MGGNGGERLLATYTILIICPDKDAAKKVAHGIEEMLGLMREESKARCSSQRLFGAD